MSKKSEYWEERGDLSYKYENESFYTVTPIPFYYKRRKILVEMLFNLLNSDVFKKICDFGCGDGWYLNHFSERFNNRSWLGIDISVSMIKKAKQKCPHIDFIVHDKGIPSEDHFDLIYSLAVFAHILDDNKIKHLFNNIYSHLQYGGSFVLFEQTGPKTKKGTTWTRRQPNFYIKNAEEAGFELKNTTLIAFPYHRFFEIHIAPFFYKYLFRGKTYYEKCINANKSIFFQNLSKIFLNFSAKYKFESINRYEGNTLFHFIKKNR